MDPADSKSTLPGDPMPLNRVVGVALLVAAALAGYTAFRSGQQAAGVEYVTGLLAALLLLTGAACSNGRRLVRIIVPVVAVVAVGAAVVVPFWAAHRAERALDPVGHLTLFDRGLVQYWDADDPAFPTIPNRPLTVPVAVVDGPVAAAEVVDVSRVAAYDRKGQELWAAEALPDVGIVAIAADGTVVVSGCTDPDDQATDQPGCLTIGFRDGNELWRSEVGHELAFARPVGDSSLTVPASAVALDDDGTLRRFDATTGAVDDKATDVTGQPFLTSSDRVLVLALDGCTLTALAPEQRVLASCATGGRHDRLVFDEKHALSVLGGDLIDLDTGTATSLPNLAPGATQQLVGDHIARSDVQRVTDDGGGTTLDTRRNRTGATWVEFLDLSGNEIERYEGPRLDWERGTVATVRSVRLRSPFSDETVEVIDVREPGTGRLCARSSSSTIDRFRALPGCAALVEGANGIAHRLSPTGTKSQ